jgi:hypothetical protein
MRDDLPDGLTAEIVDALVSASVATLEPRIAEMRKGLSEQLADESDQKKVSRLPTIIQQLCSVENWPIVYGAGTFERNLRQFIADDGRYYPRHPTQKEITDDVARFIGSWVNAYSLRSLLIDYSDAAIRMAALLNPPLDPSPLTALLRRNSWSDSDGGAFVFADDLARRVVANQARENPPRPEDLPPGNWLMPPLSLREIGKRLGNSNKKKIHVLLDQYLLRNFPKDNRQSWTVCLDPPMPNSLRKQIEKLPKK